MWPAGLCFHWIRIDVSVWRSHTYRGQEKIIVWLSLLTYVWTEWGNTKARWSGNSNLRMVGRQSIHRTCSHSFKMENVCKVMLKLKYRSCEKKTAQSRVILEDLMVFQFVNIFSKFYGTENSLLWSQKPATFPYPELDESGPRPSILFLYLYSNIIFQPTPRLLSGIFPSRFPTKNLHAFPFSPLIPATYHNHLLHMTLQRVKCYVLRGFREIITIFNNVLWQLYSLH